MVCPFPPHLLHAQIFLTINLWVPRHEWGSYFIDLHITGREQSNLPLNFYFLLQCNLNLLHYAFVMFSIVQWISNNCIEAQAINYYRFNFFVQFKNSFILNLSASSSNFQIFTCCLNPCCTDIKCVSHVPACYSKECYSSE